MRMRTHARPLRVYLVTRIAHPPSRGTLSTFGIYSYSYSFVYFVFIDASDGRMVALAYPSVAHAARRPISIMSTVDTSEAAAIRSHVGIRRVGRSRANNKIVVSDGGNHTGWPRKKITESVDRQNRIILVGSAQRLSGRSLRSRSLKPR